MNIRTIGTDAFMQDAVEMDIDMLHQYCQMEDVTTDSDSIKTQDHSDSTTFPSEDTRVHTTIQDREDAWDTADSSQATTFTVEPPLPQIVSDPQNCHYDQYLKQRDNEMPFTFIQHLLLRDTGFNTNRTKLLHQVFDTMKQENDTWTARHGSLGIFRCHLECWARAIENAVARSADDSMQDYWPTFFRGARTAQEIYNIGEKDVVMKMQDLLNFFKVTAKEFGKVVFVEDDKAVVDKMYCGERKWAENACLTRRISSVTVGNGLIGGEKRAIGTAFGNSQVGESARKLFRDMIVTVGAQR
ncbi:hypothetical protein BU23DRAFT_569250 [Bimuria novae-zelandiae CBS 107.79]|uniref:Uncharacterized protein n=1 Tax=Bimuria novae-zelandiae CBS 107.79 TaxID=1447943 RepID=A0A6A5VG40_9PLEO|nr:hypothetical protein BU23DRAFT_569250 [Bimuria novae-zelandiae CBS 107.79]